MSAGLFSKALKGAGFSITTTKDGMRSFRSEHDDRADESSKGGKVPRGSWRGGRGNWRGSSRGHRGNRSRGGRRGRRGGQHYSYSSGGSQDEVDVGVDCYGDEDINMDDSESEKLNRRYTPYGSRPSYRQPNKFQQSKSQQGYRSRETWNKIIIPNGRKHDKEWLLKRLQNSCGVSFQPIEFHYSHEHAIFFVNDKRSAEALQALSGTITVRDGSKLVIQVRQCGPPKITSSASTDSSSIDEDVLKQCLNTRYDSITQSLDLSNFYHDQVLNENNIQGVLNRPWLLGMIIKLIKEFCPQLQNLDLRNNRISYLDGLKELHEAAPQIHTLHLGENNLRHISELEKIKKLKELKSLVTDGNPLCDNYKNSQTGYVSAMRSIFPNLVTLDNCELPAHIGFDLPSSTSLPEVKGSFIPDDVTKKLVLPFVKQTRQQCHCVQKESLLDAKVQWQYNPEIFCIHVKFFRKRLLWSHRLPKVTYSASRYFEVYDSDNRQKLLDAYDDEAVFSLCVGDYMKDREKGSSPLNVYRKYSRNMKFLHDPARRLELLKTSRLSVVALLNELPSTSHDLTSLTVDINFVQQTCMGFTVCGVFREGDNQELRAFTRVFLAVPAAGNSIAIINDQMTIRNPTQDQRQLANKSPGFAVASVGQTVSAFPTAISVPSTPVSTPSTGAGLSAEQQQMVNEFSKQSGMNMAWSYKALVENSWDYQKAAHVFKSLHAQGSVPQEAFAK